MLDNGHIKLHRAIVNWEWYTDVNTKSVFIHLLLVANWKTDKWRGIDVKRGQRLTSYGHLAKENGLSVQNIRTALKHLESTGEVTIKSTNKNILITIINYDAYQKDNTLSNTQLTRSQQATNTPPTTNKESKKARRQEKDPPPISPPEPQKQKYADFVSMTNDEYTSLVAKVGEQGAKQCIEMLDNYKGANGKRYKSDYRAILNWVIENYQQKGGAHEPKRSTKDTGLWDRNVL